MKKDKTTGAAAGDFRQLVRELLGLEPAGLAAMDTEHHSVGVGLNLVLRLTLERATSMLWAPDGTTIRLRSDASAKALGWANAKTYALSSLLAWALIQAPRRARGLSYVALCPVDPDVIDMPRPIGVPNLGSAQKATAAVIALFKEDIGAVRDAPGLDERQTMPICALVEDLLGLEPAVIVRAWHDTRKDADEAFARDPEGQVAAALAAWMMSILDTHLKVLDQKIDTIRLFIGNDALYKGPASARYANIGAIVLAGLLAEDYRDIGFLMPDAA